MDDKKNQDTTDMAAAARNGPGPTPGKFDAAVQKLLERGEKLTVRSIAAITGGTVSVVTRMLREYRGQQASQVRDQALPDAFILAAKELVIAARAEAESTWQQRYQSERDAQVEVELLLLESERREVELRAALDAQTVAAKTDAALLKIERESHQATQDELESALTAVAEATAKAHEYQGKCEGALMAVNARDQDLRMHVGQRAESERRIEAIVRENEKLRALVAHRSHEPDAERRRNDNDNGSEGTQPEAGLDADAFENDDPNDADRNPLSDGVPPSQSGQETRPITGPVPTPTGSGCVAEGRLGAGTASDVTEGATSVAPDGAAVAGPATGPFGASRT